MPRCEGRVLGVPWSGALDSLPWRPRGRMQHCSRTDSTLLGNNGDGATLQCSAARSACRQDAAVVARVEVKGDGSQINLVSLFSQENGVIVGDGRGAGGGGARSVKGIS